MFIVSRVDYHRYQKPWFVYGVLRLRSFCLIAVFAFPEINGRADG